MKRRKREIYENGNHQPSTSITMSPFPSFPTERSAFPSILIFILAMTISSLVFSADSSSHGGASKNFLTSWWSQNKGATDGWFGLAEPMQSYGLAVSAEAKEVYFGQVSGGLPNQPGSSWLNEEKLKFVFDFQPLFGICLLYTSPSPRDRTRSRMPSSA